MCRGSSVGKRFVQANIEDTVLESREEEKKPKESIEELKEDAEPIIEEYIFIQSDNSTLLTELNLKSEETIQVPFTTK